MAVHPSSVIQTWINDYYPAFYTALTDQEEYAYNSNGGLDIAEWIPKFTNLMSAINSWKGASRNLEDWFIQFYTYLITTAQFPTITFPVPYDPAISDAYYVFSMNNFPTTCIGRPVSYYNDLVEDPPGTFESAKITADIATINAYATLENSRRTTLSSGAQSNAQKVVAESLFETPTVTPLSKPDIADLIFNDLNWLTFNDLLSLDLPVPSYL